MFLSCCFGHSFPDVLFHCCSAASICATRQLRNPEFSLVEPSSLSSQQTARARVHIFFLLLVVVGSLNREFTRWCFLFDILLSSLSLMLAYISFYPPPPLCQTTIVCVHCLGVCHRVYIALYIDVYIVCVCACVGGCTHPKEISLRTRTLYMCRHSDGRRCRNIRSSVTAGSYRWTG